MDNENKNDKEKLKKVNVMTWEKQKEESRRIEELFRSKADLLKSVEEEFDIEISDEDADTLHTVGELKQYIADAEKRDRVVEAKKKPSILGRDHPLFFGKDRLLHNFWIGILLFLLFIFFGQFTDYKYR